MVGTLQQKKEIYALVKTPDNSLFRVRPATIWGRTSGASRRSPSPNIKLKEIVQDSGGKWKRRSRFLLLQEGNRRLEK